MNKNSAYQKYMGTKVQTSGSQNLLLMLHQGAVKFLNLAEKAIEEDEFAEANEHLIRSQDIINEIRFSFSETDDELAKNVRGLYAYMHRRLIEANVEKDTERVAQVRDMVKEMHEAWQEATKSSREDADGSINVTG